MTKHPALNIWYAMIARCHHSQTPQYKNYGARGIAVCQEWRDSRQAFFDYLDRELGPRPSLGKAGHSLDRIDNDRGYEPGNVRWSTTYDQRRNSRQNLYVEIDGVSLPYVDMCARYGIDPRTVSSRRARGMELIEAIVTPTVDKTENWKRFVRDPLTGQFTEPA